MLLDSQCLFSDAQSILQKSVVSQNVIKFGKNDVSFVPVLIQVVEDFAGVESLKVKIETSATADFTASTVLDESTLSSDDLVTGQKFPICHLPHGNLGYMRLTYVTDAVATKGKITAGVVMNNDYSYHDMA